MNAQVRSRAVLGLQWTVGLVLIVESLRFAFEPSAARHFARTGMPLWMRPALAWTEITATILFLVPFTMLPGGYLLLVIFFLAALLHVLHGEFDIGVLLVYAMAVLVSMAYRSGAKSETAHDGQRATERI
jgi:DoxX-like family